MVIDEKRLAALESGFPGTGIMVRAQRPGGRWVAVDIWALTPASLLTWLRSRGGANPWAENVVASLLGWDEPIATVSEDTDDTDVAPISPTEPPGGGV